MSKLNRKSKKILQSLDLHPNSSVKHSQTALDTESLLTIAGLSEPKTKVTNSALESIDATTKSVLDQLQSPTKRKKTKKSSVLSLETKMALDSLKEKPAKSHSTDLAIGIDATTKSVLDQLQSPLGYQNAIYKTIVDSIEVGVSYDDISNLMVGNDISWSDIQKFTKESIHLNAVFPFYSLVSHLCMYTPANVLDALSCDNENVLSKPIIFVLLKRKTTINSSIYGACIKRVIPDLIPTKNHAKYVRDHMIKLIQMSCLSNFQEIMMLFIERIPYLKPDCRDELYRDDDDGKSIVDVWWKYLWNIKNVLTSLYDLPGYLVAIRGLRLNTMQLEKLAKSTKGLAVTLVEAFETGWEEMIKNQFRAYAGGSLVLSLMLLAQLNPGVAAISGAATVYYLWNDKGKIQTLEEYERYKMICECLYRSGDERGVVPDSMEGYSCLNPKEIKKEVVEMNLRIEEMQLEVEKLERWWQTAIRRPIDFEEEEGENIQGLQTVNEQGVAAYDAPAQPWTTTAFNFMFGGNEENDPTKIKAAKSAQIIERLEDTMKTLSILYFNIQYLDVRLRICSTYYNLEDCTLDMKLVKDLMSKAVNYNNILKRFNVMSEEKMKRSVKRKTRDTKIKRKENNTVAAAINRQTKKIKESVDAQTTTLKDWQVKVGKQFQHVEGQRKESARISKDKSGKIHARLIADIAKAQGTATAAAATASAAAVAAAACC